MSMNFGLISNLEKFNLIELSSKEVEIVAGGSGGDSYYMSSMSGSSYSTYSTSTRYSGGYTVSSYGTVSNSSFSSGGAGSYAGTSNQSDYYYGQYRG